VISLQSSCEKRHCRAAATAAGLCFFCANPSRAAELGRGGGKTAEPAPEGLETSVSKVHGLACEFNVVAKC